MWLTFLHAEIRFDTELINLFPFARIPRRSLDSAAVDFIFGAFRNSFAFRAWPFSGIHLLHQFGSRSPVTEHTFKICLLVLSNTELIYIKKGLIKSPSVDQYSCDSGQRCRRIMRSPDDNGIAKSFNYLEDN